MARTIDTMRRMAVRAAKDLKYEEKVIENLEAAKTEGEIERIMMAVRKGGRDE